jgi:hypothetical protein
MAKFYVAYKSPDTPYDSMREAKSTIPAGDVERVCDKFGIGEELILELDTEAMTCVVMNERWSEHNDEYYEKLSKEWQEEKDAEAAEAARWEAAENEEAEYLGLDFVPPAPSVYRTSSTYPTALKAEVVPDSQPDFEGETIQRIPIKAPLLFFRG